MLQDKYLLISHFRQKHSVEINASPAQVWPIIDQMDFSGSWIIRMLFTLRGMPSRMTKREGLERGKFMRLEQIESEELIIGLVGQFWKPNGNLQTFKPHEFVFFSTPEFLRATWNFRLIPKGENQTQVETETRIFCSDDVAMKKFLRYWFFIKPFSGIIRKEILRGIKKKAELKSKI